MNIQFIYDLISYMALAIAYIISTTLAGYFQAYVAKKLGDPAPEQLGFLSLNPAAHIDPIGALCLFMIGIGWGKFMPINSILLYNAWHLTAFLLSSSLMYLLIGLIALLMLLLLCGSTVVQLVAVMVSVDFTSLAAFTKNYPNSSSLTLTVAFILFMFVYVGVVFAALTIIANGLRGTVAYLIHRSGMYINEVALFLISAIVMILLARPLRIMFMAFITCIAQLLAPLLGTYV
ncbi:MAG: hypothetical protein WCE21_03740 [Candidatus Babeliales bacterium]